MGKLAIKDSLTRKIGRAGFFAKKHSPEILAATGVASIIGGTVMACKATTKASKILEESKKNMSAIDECIERAAELPEQYTNEDAKKDRALVYTQTGLKLVKAYGPAIAMTTFGLVCLLSSNNILRKRNVALAAAYTTVEQGFRSYRDRVVERFGEEVDKELKYNIKAKQVEETVVDENGEEKVVTKTVQTVDSSAPSPFSRIFDCGNPGWRDNAEDNLFFLIQQQNWANEKLRSKGYLFLNDVYDMLGFPRNKAGQIVGWTYVANGDNPNGDNYVDFGLYDINKAPQYQNVDFINGREKVAILDFNVDGNILDLI
jgi:hypothetical protein